MPNINGWECDYCHKRIEKNDEFITIEHGTLNETDYHSSAGWQVHSEKVFHILCAFKLHWKKFMVFWFLFEKKGRTR